jgi:hypothetical protein
MGALPGLVPAGEPVSSDVTAARCAMRSRVDGGAIPVPVLGSPGAVVGQGSLTAHGDQVSSVQVSTGVCGSRPPPCTSFCSVQQTSYVRCHCVCVGNQVLLGVCWGPKVSLSV